MRRELALDRGLVGAIVDGTGRRRPDHQEEIVEGPHLGVQPSCLDGSDVEEAADGKSRTDHAHPHADHEDQMQVAATSHPPMAIWAVIDPLAS